jgi:Cytochrome P460
MRRSIIMLVAVVALGGVVDYMAPASERGDGEAAPIYGVRIPAGYRDWKLIAVNHLLIEGKADQLRAQLGNDIAIKAIKEGKIPFPDGSIIAAIHWTRVPSEDNNKVLAGPFPGAQSFVVGSPLNVQFMVKDSKTYAATGGWGSLISRTASLPARRCTKPAIPATSPPKIATLSSPITHLDTESHSPCLSARSGLEQTLDLRVEIHGDREC